MASFFLKFSFVLFVAVFAKFENAKSQIVFKSYNDLWSYCLNNKIELKNNKLKLIQAQKAILAAKVNVADFQLNVSPSLIKNTKLPVNILPGDAFGGIAGSYKEVRMGTPINFALPLNIDVKLFNPTGWVDYTLAKTNNAIVNVDDKLSKKAIFESITDLYFNIIMLQEQHKNVAQNSAFADSILIVAENKYKAGLLKQQDLNNAKVNLINVQENYTQISYLLKQQVLNLKAIIDMPDSLNVVFEQTIEAAKNIEENEVAESKLAYNNMVLKEKFAKENLKKVNYSLYPTISFVFNNANNMFGQKLSSVNNTWVNSNYIGLKLNFNLPNAQIWTNRNNAKLNLNIATNNLRQTKLKAENEVSQLRNNYNKAYALIATQTSTKNLQKDTYEKNMNLYKAGLIGVEKIIESNTNYINAAYALTNSNINVALAKAKIEINNSMQ